MRWLIVATTVAIGAWLARRFGPGMVRAAGLIAEHSTPTLDAGRDVAVELTIQHPRRPELFEGLQERISTALPHLKVRVTVGWNSSDGKGWVILVPNDEATLQDLFHDANLIGGYFLKAFGFDVVDAFEQSTGQRLRLLYP